MKTTKMNYQIDSEEYKLYHLIYLYAQSLDINKSKSDNDFWINEIQKEINNSKK